MRGSPPRSTVTQTSSPGGLGHHANPIAAQQQLGSLAIDQRLPRPPPGTPMFIPLGKRSTRIRDITPPKLMGESACLKRLTTYAAYTIRKCPPQDLNEGRGTWAKSTITEERWYQEEIIRDIQKLSNRGGTVADKKKTLIPMQQAQITTLVDDLTSREVDRAFEWSLVQLDTLMVPVRLEREKKAELDEAVAMIVFVKRAPRRDFDPVILYQNIEKRKTDSMAPLQQPQGHSVIEPIQILNAREDVGMNEHPNHWQMDSVGKVRSVDQNHEPSIGYAEYETVETNLFDQSAIEQWFGLGKDESMIGMHPHNRERDQNVSESGDQINDRKPAISNFEIKFQDPQAAQAFSDVYPNSSTDLVVGADGEDVILSAKTQQDNVHEAESPDTEDMKPKPKPGREVTKDEEGRFVCNWAGCTQDVRSFNKKSQWLKASKPLLLNDYCRTTGFFELTHLLAYGYA